MTSTKLRTTEVQEISTILQRIGEKDRSAFRECVDAYGNFIWALARKLTHSRRQAEKATEEIFTDIWRYCERPANGHLAEKSVIAVIALSRLLRGNSRPDTPL